MAISIIPLLFRAVLIYFLLKNNFHQLDDKLTKQITQSLKTEISYKNESIAKAEGRYVEQEIDRIGNKMTALVQSPDFINEDVDKIDKYLDNILRSEPGIVDVRVIDRFGDEVYKKISSLSVAGDELADVTQDEIFKTLEQKEPYVSKVAISSRTQQPFVTLGQPITEMGGNFKGGIIINLSLNFIWSISFDKQMGDKAILFIISQDGQLISHPSQRELNENSDYSKYDYIQKILELKDGTITNQDKLLSFYTNKYNWTTIIQVPTETALAPVIQNRSTIDEFIQSTTQSVSIATGVILLVVMLLSALSSVYLTRRVINPIINLTAATKSISEGQLQTKIVKRSNDEVGELTDSFNKMTEELRRKQNELVKSNEYIKQQAEDLLDRYNSDLEQFAYVTTHDLIEPLRMITSYTQLLQRRYKNVYDDDAKEFMNYIVEGVERMHHIINDLFEYSHIRTNIKDFQEVDIQDVYREVKDKLNKEIGTTDARVTSGTLPIIKGVRSNIVQLFQNLIANAIKFRKKDEPITIQILAEERAHEWLFSFKDNGIGLDPVYKDKIFEIFKRLHKRDEYPGSGMGLAICKNIVERHGGKIWVDSRVGEGATFYFTIKKFD